MDQSTTNRLKQIVRSRTLFPRYTQPINMTRKINTQSKSSMQESSQSQRPFLNTTKSFNTATIYSQHPRKCLFIDLHFTKPKCTVLFYHLHIFQETTHTHFRKGQIKTMSFTHPSTAAIKPKRLYMPAI